MPEAKFQIKRKCEVCGDTFIAKTLDSRYCCRHCADIAYKKRKADKAKEERLNQIAQIIPGERDFISVKEAVAMEMVTMDDLFIDSMQVISNAAEVRRLIVVPNAEQLYNKVREGLRHADDEKRITVLAMQPMEGGNFRQEILGYSLMAALGIKGEELNRQ